MGLCYSTRKERVAALPRRPEHTQEPEIDTVREDHVLYFRPVIRTAPEEKHTSDKGAEIRQVFGI